MKDTSYPSDNLKSLEEDFGDQWADLFIVSSVSVSDDPALYAQGMDTPIAGVRVVVDTATGAKCQRCWKVLTAVGTVAEHAQLCPRCAKVVKAMGIASAADMAE